MVVAQNRCQRDRSRLTVNDKYDASEEWRLVGCGVTSAVRLALSVELGAHAAAGLVAPVFHQRCHED